MDILAPDQVFKYAFPHFELFNMAENQKEGVVSTAEAMSQVSPTDESLSGTQ